MTQLKWAKRIRRTKKNIEKFNPDLVISVDSPDFNFRVVKGLKGKCHCVDYVAPQAWAWRPGRRKKLGELYDQLLVIWPFEVEFFEGFGADVTFVGLPVLDHLESDLLKQKEIEAVRFVPRLAGLG